MLNILAAIFLFGLIVLIHEFGHFLFAKLNGIGVLEFAIGMGPSVVSFVRGETRYSIKLLPFGGYCAMLGEDTGDTDPRAFHNKSAWARISVIAAGPAFNFILAFLFAMVMVAQIGHDRPVLTGVSEGSPAQEAGLLAGDKITRIDRRNVVSYRDISMYLFANPDKPVTLHYERPAGGVWEKGVAVEKRSVEITPKFDETYQAYMLGVQFAGYQKVESPWEVVRYGAYEVRNCITSTFDGFRMMFRRQIKLNDAIAGPVKIVTMVGETVEEGRAAGGRAVLYVMSNWILLLSASLGIMNLLPIPALDGGRLLFLLIEVLRGKPMDREKEGMIHMVGMMFLMGIMVLVLVNDIRGLF